MPRTAPTLLPRLSRLLDQLGRNLKMARLRRMYSADLVAQRASISRKTLFRVENGDPAVALGIYARVLQVLRLEQGLALLADDDELGRKLQDIAITPRQRSPKKTDTAPEPAEVLPEDSDGTFE